MVCCWKGTEDQNRHICHKAWYPHCLSRKTVPNVGGCPQSPATSLCLILVPRRLPKSEKFVMDICAYSFKNFQIKTLPIRFRGDWDEIKQGQVETVTIRFMGDNA